MRINAFHVDQFGVLHNLTVEGLAPGLSIFLGNNEAGKSTCLDFIRVMLTGYTDRRTNEGKGRDYATGLMGQGGGSLHLDTAQGPVRLLRRPGPSGGALTLTDAEGNPLDVGLLDRLMGGITRQVFRNIYGFSLTELQEFNNLNSQEVRNALYGASFGLGLRSPGAAQKRLEAEMETLFKQGGSKQPLSEGLRSWEELRRFIREAENESAQYDVLAGELHGIEQSLTDLRKDRTAQNQESRDLERRLGVWQLWEEWRVAGLRLARLDLVADTFPPGGLARLERAEDRCEEAARQCRLMNERVDAANAELGALKFDQPLLSLADELRLLSERRASCRNASAEIPRLVLELHRAHSGLVSNLATLGPEWTTDRIRTVDRSLFVREEMEHQASAMHVAETTYNTTMAAMDKSVREADEARHIVELAARTLESLPVPVADLDESARGRLRKSLARTEDAQDRLPERMKAHEILKSDFSRAVLQLRLGGEGDPVVTLDKLYDAQDAALKEAGTVLSAKLDADLANTLAEQAKEAEKQARLRMTRLKTERDERGVPTRDSLEARREALRKTRRLSAELDREQSGAREVQEGFAAHLEALPKTKSSMGLVFGGLSLALTGLFVLGLYANGLAVIELNEYLGLSENIPALSLSNPLGGLLMGCGLILFLAGQIPEVRRRLLLVLGGLFAATGGATIVAKRMFAIPSLALPSNIVVPLELWSGYLILLTGVICLGLGLRRKGDASPQALVTAQWRQRCEDAKTTVKALEKDLQALLSNLGAATASPEDLDTLEARLDEEREQWATNERMEQEMTTHAQEIAELHRRTVELETDFSAKTGQVRNYQRQWHACLLTLGVRQEIPAPESAQTFFMRVENARRDWAAVKALDAELNDMQACGDELIQLGRELLPAKVQPANWASLGEVLDAVRRVLESCREADMAAEERARATEALRGAETQTQRTQSVQAEAVETLHQAEQRLQAAREVWRASLANLGLGLELSPTTTREALDCMGRSLDAEAEVLRLRGELDRQNHERDAFVLPLTKLFETLTRTPRLNPEGQPDWLASHDAILQEVEDNRLRDETRRRLELVRNGQEEDLRAAAETEHDARRQVDELLRLAEVDDAEAFRHMDAIRKERDGLVRRREDIEDSLRRAADETPLKAFLDEFASLDKEQLENRLTDLGTQSQETAQHEESLADSAGNLRAELNKLASSDTLTGLRVQEASLNADLHTLGLEWSRHALAKYLLIEARRRFEKERQPEVIRSASEIFSAITDKSWIGLNASLEDGQLRVLPAHGEPTPPEQLSRGAQEQLYLSLRLAHIRNHASLTSPLPVIMDDILVNFDPDRASRTAEALMSLTKDSDHGPGHQILYFTCHPQMAEMLHDMGTGSMLYRIDRGRIRATS